VYCFLEGSIKVNPQPDIKVRGRRFSAFLELIENINLNKMVREMS
jgi:hypothetical protein